MKIDKFASGAALRGLTLLGGLHPTAQDNCPLGTKTLLLLGPDPETFWPTLQRSTEADGPDAVDRWSRRVIGQWACDLGAKALFPFGTPVHPFFTWALRSGRCNASPVHLLVHDSQGLMVSFRGALALKEHIDLPAAPPNPCTTCDSRACLSACPVDAITTDTYDLTKCHAHLAMPQNACMEKGCAARRACPISPPRPDAQSAHHMEYFHR